MEKKIKGIRPGMIRSVNGVKESDKKTLKNADMVSLEGKCNPVDLNGGILR